MLLQALHHRRDGRVLLPDRHVDADHPRAALIDDRVDRDRGLAGAAVPDDQLALAPPDRDHRVDRLDPGLERLLHRLAADDSRRHHVHLAARARLDGPQPIDRPAQGVHDAPHERRPDGHLEHPPGAPHLVPFTQLEVVAENDGPDVVLLQVQGEAGDPLPRLGGDELEHLARHGLGEAVHASDAVLHFEDRAHLADVDLCQVGGLDFLQQDLFELTRSQDGIGRHRNPCWWLVKFIT